MYSIKFYKDDRQVESSRRRNKQSAIDYSKMVVDNSSYSKGVVANSLGRVVYTYTRQE